MREIKFRGKRVDNDKWIEGFVARMYYDGNDEFVYTFMLDTTKHIANLNAIEFKVIPETVGQYTGLKDKNGKEIFEGDIVKVACPYSFNLKAGEIRYNDGCFDIIGNTGGRDYLKCHTVNHAVEVIGNIYENPELLEVE